MNKPKIKKELAIAHALKALYIIYFYASPDAIEDLYDFGMVEPQDAIADSYYSILVDRRYDIDDVVEYMENYG